MGDVAENNKRIAKNTLVLYVRMIFMLLINLYTSRVVLSALGVEDFGIYNVVGGIVAFLSFVNSAMSTGTQRFLTFEIGRGNNERLHTVFITSVYIHFLIVLLIIVLSETLGIWFLNNRMVIPEDRIIAANWVFQTSVLSACVMFVSVPYNATIIAHERMNVFAVVSILDAVLKLGITILLLVVTADRLIVYGILILSVQIIIRTIYGIYCRRNFTETKVILMWDKNVFKEMLSFSVWNLWGSASHMAMNQGQNIILNLYFGPIVNAAKGIANQVQTAVLQLATNFQTAINPQIIKSYSSGNFDYMHSLVYRASRFSFCLLLCVCLPVLIETEALLQLWLKEIPEYSVIFVRLMIFSSLINSLANPLMTSAQATGKVKLYQSLVGGVLLMILPTSYLVLKLGGEPYSVFIVEIILCAVAFGVRLIIVRSLVNISLSKYFTNVILRSLLLTMLSIILPLVFKNILKASLLSTLIICFISAVSVIVFSFLVAMTTSERLSILKNLKQHILKK